jgi:putative transposase
LVFGQVTVESASPAGRPTRGERRHTLKRATKSLRGLRQPCCRFPKASPAGRPTRSERRHTLKRATKSLRGLRQPCCRFPQASPAGRPTRGKAATLPPRKERPEAKQPHPRQQGCPIPKRQQGCRSPRGRPAQQTESMDKLPSDDECLGTRDWPHAPPHRLSEAGVYFVTARARNQADLFHTPERRDWLQDLLFEVFRENGWNLEAWAVLSNHYHVVAHSPAGNSNSLGPLLQKLHSLSTKRLNAEDATPGRTRLWQNYRETHLTYQKSYLARLNYVHQNARHHGLVASASQWRWCSAAAFEEAVSPAWAKTVASFAYEEIAASDGE